MQAVMLSGTARLPGQCCFSPLEPSLLQPPALINDLGNSLCWGMTEFTLHKCWPQLKHTHLPYYLSIIFQRYRKEDKIIGNLQTQKKFFTLPMSKINLKVPLPCYRQWNNIHSVKPSFFWLWCKVMWLWCAVWKVQEDNTVQHAH